MKKIFTTALFAGVCMVSNAKTVDITIKTSCGEEYHISEIGDNVTTEQMVEFSRMIDDTFCG